MNRPILAVSIVLAVGGVAGCEFSGDSAFPVRQYSTVANRDLVEIIRYQGRAYEVQDITFEYSGGRIETRRYVIIGMRRVGCGGENCQDALERGLANTNEGDDDY